MAIRNTNAEARILPRALAGATVLQIVTALEDDAPGHATMDIAHSLVRAGARAIIAAPDGALVNELKSFGGEWLPFANATVNPLRLRRNAEALTTFVAEERIDVVHAKNPGAAWSAKIASDRNGVPFVTELPDVAPGRLRPAFNLAALGQGDRIIARSLFGARPMIERYGISTGRLVIIPRSINTAHFDPATVKPERVAALRHAWGIPSGVRIVLVPGPVAPFNGQMTVVSTARVLTDNGMRGVTFVFAGDDRRHARYARNVANETGAQGVAALFRMVGHCPDMPAAYAAADFVVVPAIEPPMFGRTVAEAQAMARPVITSAVGPLAEMVAAPPRMRDELRTGWVVPPDEPIELARALTMALALDAPAYRALAARARKFADFTFSPPRAAAATLEAYTSLLAIED